jgi:hypothetical protein
VGKQRSRKAKKQGQAEKQKSGEAKKQAEKWGKRNPKSPQKKTNPPKIIQYIYIFIFPWKISPELTGMILVEMHHIFGCALHLVIG